MTLCHQAETVAQSVKSIERVDHCVSFCFGRPISKQFAFTAEKRAFCIGDASGDLGAIRLK